jgi:type III pantothenate kinase
MLLVLDAGNTNVTIGVYDGERLVTAWRLRTDRDQTADEWGIKLRQLFTIAGLKLEQVDGMAIASVVPPVDRPLAEMCRRYFNSDPLLLTVDLDLGIRVDIDNPREAGADRLANAAAAYAEYGGPCVVVDFGTAMNFDVVSRDGAFLGGLICPGIGLAASGLYQKTARLPLVDFREPRSLIGRNTVDCIQSGLYYSVVSAVDGILERVAGELGSDTKFVATGGQAELIRGGSRVLKIVDPDLTLKGLLLAWRKNRP